MSALSRLAAPGPGRDLYPIALPVGLGITLLIAWEIIVKASGMPAVILPAPSDVVASFARISGDLARNAMATGTEAMIAFVLATLLGVAAALVLSSSALVFEAIYPHVVLFQIVPKIALAPLFTFWLGIQSPSRLAYSVFISFFPVALATMTGLARTDVNALRLSRALTASRWRTFLSVRIPYALPYFFSGLKIAATMSIIGIVVGEFISARQGLGYYILFSQARGETAHIFAALVVLCVIGLVPYVLTIKLEQWVRRWWRG